MAFDDLQKAIAFFEKKDRLVRISEPIDPNLEITEISDRVVKAAGPALLFDKPTGYDIPVLTNLYGTRDRVETIFGLEDLDQIGRRLTELLDLEPPRGWLDKLKLLPKLKDAAALFPKKVTDAPCQEVVKTDAADLTELPVLTCWPGDGGPFITLPVVITNHPVTGKRNVGMYRVQVFDAKTAGMHWHIHKGGADHYRQVNDGRPFPVAVALGPDPITTYCATAPVPDGIDEMIFSGFLRRKPVEMVKCVTCDLEVPAQSQIVLEGYVQPGELRTEGPFGDHTGFYSPADQYPVFHLEAITMRREPVYPATIVGYPPMEDEWLGKLTERLFLPLMRQQLPEIVDLNLPTVGCFHNLVFVSIDKRYPGHARKIMHALWGLGQMMFSKMIFVFDKEVDVQDLNQVLFYLGANTDPARDTAVVSGPMDALEHASPLPHLGGKIGFDCTRKWASEGYNRDWPDLIKMDDRVVAKIDGLWSKLGL